MAGSCTRLAFDDWLFHYLTSPHASEHRWHDIIQRRLFPHLLAFQACCNLDQPQAHNSSGGQAVKDACMHAICEWHRSGTQ